MVELQNMCKKIEIAGHVVSLFKNEEALKLLKDAVNELQDYLETYEMEVTQ